MSQETETCGKCGELCGYDDSKGYWNETNKSLCSLCKKNLTSRFKAFFGLDGCSSDHVGLEIEWNDADRILEQVKRDYEMRISYIVTDKELYERTAQIPTPIMEDII